VWAGYSDPCNTRDRIAASDPEREANFRVFQAWHRTIEDRPVLAREIISRAQEDEEFQEALLTVAAARQNVRELDARRLGNWCRSVENRIIGGLRLTRGREIDRAQTWRLSFVSLMSSRQGDQNGSDAHATQQ
jgi:hypothetical protein